MSLTRHTSYRTAIFRGGATVTEEFCTKEGLPWPCDTELRDMALDSIADQVLSLPAWDKRSVPGGLHISRREVLRIVREAR